MEFLLLVLVWEMHQVRMFSLAPGTVITLYYFYSRQVDPSILFTSVNLEIQVIVFLGHTFLLQMSLLQPAFYLVSDACREHSSFMQRCK